ncbi:MAG: type II CAAX endopeptidase family protein [Bacteroidales bacterium]|jgi:membrane protease YdiL (CAAX protease family)|nr:type II CAAX endopeptidase family protein [Bacteroidales bacterium]
MKILIETLKELFSSENEFFALARTGKRITHIAIAIPIIIVFLLGGAVLSEGIGSQLILKNIKFSEPFKDFYSLFFTFGAIIFMVWLWVRFFEKRSIRTLGFTAKGAFKKYISGFLTGLIMLGIVIGLMALFGTIGFLENPEPFSLNFLGVMLLLLLGYIVQGASEEIIARGWQFQVIGARYRPWLGAVISSVIFALLHGFNTGVSPLAIINLLLFAFLLIFIILRDKSIWAACGWHTAWNWSMENIFGLKVSGSDGLGSVLNLSTEGPNYLTGGDFGPEGSILTTIVLIAGMFTLLILKAKKDIKSS